MNFRLNSIALAVSASTALLSTPTMVAQAQEAGMLEEVIVTATRREQGLQEVPLAVTNISSENLAMQGITGLGVIEPGTIPGTNFQRFAGDPSILSLSMRGVYLTEPTQGTAENAVAVYIDDVYLARGQGLGMELIDPERVEILRGPQGQLFGRNAEGGVVRFVTRKPTGEFGLKASATLGNYDLQRYKISVDTPEWAGFSAKIAAFTTEHDGYTEQSNREEPRAFGAPGVYTPPLPREDYGVEDSDGYRIAVRWQSDGGNFLADYAYDDSEAFNTQGYDVWTDVNNLIPAVSDQPPSDDFPDKTYYPLYNLGYTSEAEGHALTLEWSLSDSIDLKSVTAYRETSREGGTNLGVALPAGGTLGLYFIDGEDLQSEQTSQEFQFIGVWDRFDLTAGVIYFEEEIDDNRTEFLSGPVAEVIGVPAFGSPDPSMIRDQRHKAEAESWGVYAQGGWRPQILDDRLELILGLRYTDDTKEGLRYYDFGPVNLTAEFDEQRVDPAFTVRYQWTDELNTYLRYATGYRAGGVQLRSSDFNSYDQEEIEAWELGMKSRWAGGKVQLNAALFFNTIEDELIVVSEDPLGSPGVNNTINSDEDKEVWGLETEFVWAATDTLTLGLNFTYMDAEEETFLQENPFNPGLIERYWTNQVPEHSGSVYADYHQPISSGNLRAYISYAWMDDYYATGAGLIEETLGPDYKRVVQESKHLAARLGWSDIALGNGFLHLWVWGKNLTEDESSQFTFPGCASGGGECSKVAFPRTYGVELEYTY